jgi:hypothetical protein
LGPCVRTLVACLLPIPLHRPAGDRREPADSYPVGGLGFGLGFGLTTFTLLFAVALTVAPEEFDALADAVIRCSPG